MNDKTDTRLFGDVLDFWFPEGQLADVAIELTKHHEHWFWRMQGGADDEIVRRFGNLTHQAARGELAHWKRDARGRLALIIVLDQFSRSVWRGTARAYAQDQTALTLTLEGLANGHYASQTAPWLKVVFGLPLGHCEGPDHLQRIDRLISLRQDIAVEAPANLRTLYQSLVEQAQDVRKVIKAFGRHPHRNSVLGRTSTAAEQAYIADGRFPHQKAFRRGFG